MNYRPLSEAEAQQVTRALGYAESFWADMSMQTVYDALLTAGLDNNHHATETLGFLFGASLLSENWLEWGVLIDPEYGDEIGVRVIDRDLGCAPLSMIRNRLEDGEQWDLAGLRESTIHRLRHLGQHAR